MFFCHWKDEQNHRVLWEGDGLIISFLVYSLQFFQYSGTLGPNDSTAYHSHDKDTIYCILASATATNDELVPPNYSSSAPSTTALNFVYGQRLAYDRPSSPSTPYVHRVHSNSSPLAFLGIETSRPRPSPAPTPPLTRPSGTLHDSESFSFALAQPIALLPNDTLTLPPPSPAPAARILIALAGPPVAEIAFTAGGRAATTVPERHEHGQRIGGVAVLTSLAPSITSSAVRARDRHSPPSPCVITNGGDTTAEAVVFDMF